MPTDHSTTFITPGFVPEVSTRTPKGTSATTNADSAIIDVTEVPLSTPIISIAISARQMQLIGARVLDL